MNIVGYTSLSVERLLKMIAQLGTNWNNGLKAGLYWNLNNGVRNRNRNISARLVYGLSLFFQVACHLVKGVGRVVDGDLAPWQNIEMLSGSGCNKAAAIPI
jgi:hypothetical protein